MIAKKGGKVLYTGRTQTVGLMEGRSKSSDARLDIELTAPGGKGSGTNPEQLFAAGWSACFALSLAHTAKGMGVTLPADTSIGAEVDLCNTAGDYSGKFYIQARLQIYLPDLDRDVAQQVVDEAHRTCPYHEATRGNVDVEIILV